MLAGLTVLALILRCYYAVRTKVYLPFSGDSSQYFAYAWNLAHSATFSKDILHTAVISPDSYRDPAYPVFLSAAMKIFGTGDTWYSAILLYQSLLGALTVALTTQLGRHWLSKRWAFSAGLLMAIWPHSISISSFLMPETLFGFLLSLALLLFARACQMGNRMTALASGITFGISALTNAVVLPFGLLLASLLIWRSLAPKKVCLFLALGSLILPAAWAIRNVTVVPVNSAESSENRALQNFLQGTWPDFHSAWRQLRLGDTAARAHATVILSAMQQEQIAFLESSSKGASMVLRRFAEHPYRFGVWYLIEKPIELWGWNIQIGQGDIYIKPTQNSPFQSNRPWVVTEVICHTLNPILMLLTLTSFVALLCRKRWNTVFDSKNPLDDNILIPPVFLLAFVTFVYSTLQAEPRYAIPFRSFEILISMTTVAAASSVAGSYRKMSR